MTSLGNIALSLKDRVYALKSDYNVYFSLSSSFFGSKSFLRRVLLLTRLFSSSSDVGVKNLANSLTREGPMRLRGSSWMSCNLSVSESLLLRRALAFSACTCFVDPLSTWTSSGIRGKWHVCNWRHWDRPWLVLRLTGNLLQYSDMLLLVSQVVYLAPRHWMALTISGAGKQAVERALHLKQFGWSKPWCAGWTACLRAWSIRRWLWTAFRWCLRRWTVHATCTGVLCAWAARWGTGQKHWRLTSGGLWYRLWTGRLRVTGWWFVALWGLNALKLPLSAWLEWADLGQSHSV